MTLSCPGRFVALFALGLCLASAANKPTRLAQLLAEGRVLEQKQDWDGALAIYETALAGNESDVACQMAVYRARSKAADSHLEHGVKLRDEGQLDEALNEFQQALKLWP